MLGPILDQFSDKAAIVTVPMGQGEVVLIGFRVHFRAQARGTYKILFNSLYYSVIRKKAGMTPYGPPLDEV